MANIFSRIFGVRDAQRRSDSGETSDNVTTVPWVTAAQGYDEVTSSQLALKVATVFRCVELLSKGVAQLPLEIRRNAGGFFVDDHNDPFSLDFLLRWKPNERLNAFDFKRNIMQQILLKGNAYIIPEIHGEGYRRLVLLAPDTCVYDMYSNTYSVSDGINGVVGVYPAWQVIHIKNICTDGGYNGISTLAFAGRSIALSSNADLQNVETFKNGGLVRGFVSGKEGGTVGFGTIQDTQLKNVAKQIQDSINSGNNIFNLPGEMSFSQLSLSPQDIELLSTKQFNVLEICRYFGCTPDKVFYQSSTNYKASEMSQVSFLTDTLQPYLQQISQEFQLKLIPRALIDDYQIGFDTEILMQTDLITQADYMTKTLATGTRTVNEWRAKMNRPPVPGGDTALVSTNLAAVGSAKLSGGNEPESGE